MASAPVSIADEFGLALANLTETTTGLFSPTIRLGVTGLVARAKQCSSPPSFMPFSMAPSSRALRRRPRAG